MVAEKSPKDRRKVAALLWLLAAACSQAQAQQVSSQGQGITTLEDGSNAVIPGIQRLFFTGSGVDSVARDGTYPTRGIITISGGGGGGGYNRIQEEGSNLTQRLTFNFISTAVTAADNAGATRTDVTIAHTPSNATTLVGSNRLLNTTAPITGGGDLTADRTIAISAASQSAPGSMSAADKAKTDNLGAIVVRVATTAALAANTYSGSPNFTLTADANGAIATQDGVTLAANDRVLVTAEATGADNGPYIVTQVGDAGTPYILTRVIGARTSADYSPAILVVVAEGTVNANSVFMLTTDGPITLDTTSLVYARLLGSAVPAPTANPRFNAGGNATSSANNTTAVGPNSTASAAGSSAFGVSASATGASDTAIGASSSATGASGSATAVGASASAAANFATAIGASALANTANSTSLGYGAQANQGNDIALGYGAVTSAAQQCMIASSTGINTVVVGNGNTNASPVAVTYRNTSASGTDVAGSNMTFAAGRSTGSGAGGSIFLQTTPAGGSGSSLNTSTTRLTVTSTGQAIFAVGNTNRGATIYSQMAQPSSPATWSPDLMVYNGAFAGRPSLWQRDQGAYGIFGGHRWGAKRVEYLPFAGSGGSITGEGLGYQLGTVGTVTHPALATTNMQTSLDRLTLTSAASTTSYADLYSGTGGTGRGIVWRGNCAGCGGFFYTWTFSAETNTASTNAFVGFGSVGGVSDPYTRVDSIGFGYNNADTGNWYFMRRDGSAQATPVDLGSNCARSTSAVFQFSLFTPPSPATSGAPFFGYRAVNLSTQTLCAEGTVTTTLPTNTTFMVKETYLNTGSTSTSQILHIYHEEGEIGIGGL